MQPSTEGTMLPEPRSLNPSRMMNDIIVARNGANVGPITEIAIMANVTMSERAMDKQHNGVANPVDWRNAPSGWRMMWPMSVGMVLVETQEEASSPSAA
mmetsp:Transcript_15672/g.21985  ORF Transcript_15672/g.21985 Transcript_15672/m.21985 type:complete len:99 (-) Transcript_15672:333-629(-)